MISEDDGPALAWFTVEDVGAEIPAEPDDVRALRVKDEWWPRMPRGPFRHTVGMRAADPQQWLRPGGFDEPWRAWKSSLHDATGEATFLARPGSEPGGAQVLSLIREITGRDPEPRAEHPLLSAARLVVEDLCLVDISGPDPVLVAGAVAMPSRWRLGDKVGRTMLAVHGPVPSYAQEIGSATDRLMQRLGDGRIMSRVNWSILDRPGLFQPAHTSRSEQARPDVATGDDAARAMFARVEYQTVRAFPETSTVLFSIHTAREPLWALADRPAVAASLLAILESHPEQLHRYKGIEPYLGPLRECLRTLAAA